MVRKLRLTSQQVHLRVYAKWAKRLRWRPSSAGITAWMLENAIANMQNIRADIWERLAHAHTVAEGDQYIETLNAIEHLIAVMEQQLCTKAA